MKKKKTIPQNSKNSVPLSIDKERKQFYEQVYGFINTGSKYREDLVSSKFKSTSEERLKALLNFLPRVSNFIRSKTQTFKMDMSEFMLRNIEMALWFYLYNGLIIAQHGKSEISDSCLSYIDQLEELEKIYPEFRERSKGKKLELYRFIYSEIQLGHMPVEFVEAFIGLNWSIRPWNQEIKNYYCDQMAWVLRNYEIPIKNNFLIWSKIQRISKFPNQYFLSNETIHTIPDLLEPDKWRWEYFAALSYATNFELDQAREYAKRVLDNILSDPSKEKSIYKPHLLHILGKTDLAESEALRILDRDPSMILMHQLLGSIYVDMKNYKRASTIYKKAISIKPNVEIVSRLYFTLIMGENDKEAAELREQIKSENYSLFLNDLLDGMHFFILNDFKKARRSLEHIFGIGYYHIFNSYIPIKKKNSDEYEHVFCDSLHLAAKLLLGEISFIEEKYSEALKLEYEVLELYPDHHLALERISEVIAKLYGFEKISTDFKRRADSAIHTAGQISGGISFAHAEAAKSFSLFYDTKHEKRFYSQDIDLLATLEQIIESLKENGTQLLLGDTGVGKELVARIIHEQVFKDSERPFVPVNCGGITESIFESEMFGYEPGSFSGADRKGRNGYFMTANGGTIFLDEIAEIPLSKQATLLRVIQEKKVRKVGSDKEKKVDFLLISATNKDLKAMVKSGKFREDLYSRIQGAIPINIPPLKERREDISLLFMILLEKKYGPGMISIGPEALEVLKEHSLFRNVRELENIIERIAPLGYARIDAEKMLHLISIEDSEDLRGRSKLSVETRQRMRLWFSLEFKNKNELLKRLKENSDKPKDIKSLNKQFSSVFLEIGKQVKWKDLESNITLCKSERVLPEEKVMMFEKLLLKHMKALKRLEDEETIISRWVYPNDMENFNAFRNSKPKWVNSAPNPSV